MKLNKAKLESGAAAINIKLSAGIITVRHTGPEGEILAKGPAPSGSWDRIWEVLEQELGLVKEVI